MKLFTLLLACMCTLTIHAQDWTPETFIDVKIDQELEVMNNDQLELLKSDFLNFISLSQFDAISTEQVSKSTLLSSMVFRAKNLGKYCVILIRDSFQTEKYVVVESKFVHNLN